MSRSYKKFPCVKDSYSGAKKKANRKFRRSSKFADVPLNEKGYYRKCSNSYDICDWICYLSKGRFQKDYTDNKNYIYVVSDGSEEDAKNWYKKHFICK